MHKGFLNLPSPSPTSGYPPERPAPGRLASCAAFALSVWMAAAPATARAEEEGAGSAASDTAGHDSWHESDTGITAEESRRAPARRKGGNGRRGFDPKVFEARGRELQGKYYEIPALANAPTWSGLPAGLPAEDGATPDEEPASKNWILWGGVAGAAAFVAGLGGWLLIHQPGNAEPVSVYLDDKP